MTDPTPLDVRLSARTTEALRHLLALRPDWRPDRVSRFVDEALSRAILREAVHAAHPAMPDADMELLMLLSGRRMDALRQAARAQAGPRRRCGRGSGRA